MADPNDIVLAPPVGVPAPLPQPAPFGAPSGVANPYEHGYMLALPTFSGQDFGALAQQLGASVLAGPAAAQAKAADPFRLVGAPGRPGGLTGGFALPAVQPQVVSTSGYRHTSGIAMPGVKERILGAEALEAGGQKSLIESQAKLAKQMAEDYRLHSRQVGAITKAAQTRLAGLRERYGARLDDLQRTVDGVSEQLQPNRWWAERDKGERIALAIGALAAGISAGIDKSRGGKGINEVLAMTEREISKDVDKQKFDIAQAQRKRTEQMNLLGLIRGQVADEQQAMLTARTMLTQDLATKLKTLELEATDEQTKGRLAIMRAALMSRAGGALQKYFQVSSARTVSTGTTQKVSGGAGSYLKHRDQDVQALQDSAKLAARLAHYWQVYKKSGGLNNLQIIKQYFPGTDARALKAWAEGEAIQLAKSIGAGSNVSNQERQALIGNIPSASDFVNGSAQTKMRKMWDALQKSTQSILNANAYIDPRQQRQYLSYADDVNRGLMAMGAGAYRIRPDQVSWYARPGTSTEAARAIGGGKKGKR